MDAEVIMYQEIRKMVLLNMERRARERTSQDVETLPLKPDNNGLRKRTKQPAPAI
jgi:hypothetical protein